MEKITIHNLIVVDASGSMCSIYDQALTGINETIKTIKNLHEQNEGGAQYLSLLSFASGGEDLQYVYDHSNADNVNPITKKDYVLRGCTALYDAIGESVSKLRTQIKEGDKVLVTIITDGQENDSRVWTGAKVKSLVSELEGMGWVFTYIGANQDVDYEAHNIGIRNSFEFSANVEGTIHMFERERQSRRSWNERVYRGDADYQSNYFENSSEDEQANRITPIMINSLAYNEVFVFGSNAQGNHGGGAARVAVMKFGAQFGKGEGVQGQSYAIPTTGSTPEMIAAVDRFIAYARNNPDKRFLVTAIGCGHAGYTEREVAPMFIGAKNVANICLPQSFWNVIGF